MTRRTIHRGDVAFNALTVAICAFLVAPIVIVVVTAFSDSRSLAFPPPGFSLRWFQAFVGNDDFVESTFLSIRIAAIVTLVTVVIGTLAAIAVARGQFRGAESLRTVLASPLMVPYVVLGLALLIFMSSLRISSSLTVLVLAHSVVALPFVIRIVSAGLQSYDHTVEDAARSLGANRLKAFWTVALPIIRGSLVGAGVFAFMTSFDEVTITIFVSGPGTTTLPVRLFNYIEFTSDPLVSAVATLEVALAVVVVVLVDRLVGFTRFL
jgi:putative spermidine/putrescine transport system permease protein